MTVLRSWIGVVLAAGLIASACSAGGGSDASSSSTVPMGANITTDAPGSGTIVFEAGWADDARIVKIDPIALDDEVISGEEQAHVPDLTDDGEMLVWAGPSSSDQGWPDTFLRDLVTGEIRRIGPGGGPTWTFDEKALLVSRQDGVYRMDLDGSSMLVRPGASLSGTEVADGTYVFGDTSLTIVKEGEQTVVFVGDEYCAPDSWDLSPDGRGLAFTIGCVQPDDPESGLYVYDVRSAETRSVHDGDVSGAAWSPDGQSIATTYRPDRDHRENELRVVNAGTGDHEVLRSGGWSSWPIWLDLP